MEINFRREQQDAISSDYINFAIYKVNQFLKVFTDEMVKIVFSTARN